MLVEGGGLTYEWVDEWARFPGPEAARAWPHAGMSITPEGEVVTFHPSKRSLAIFDADGKLHRSVPVDISEAHGITLVVDDGRPALWLADASMKKRPEAEYSPPPGDERSSAMKVSLDDGQTLMVLPRPTHAAYESGPYAPTCVAVHETRLGGNGDVWVADGYGQSLVHRFDAEGVYRQTLTGEEGGGRFQSPHAVFIDRRRSEPELYIADRTNARIQIYGLDGRLRRVIGQDFLASPTWFVSDGELMLVVEFRPPRLTVLDGDDRLVTYLAANPGAPEREGWPNDADSNGGPVRTSALAEGKLNSPHALAIDALGDLYLTEWLIGGRLTKLRKSFRG